MSLRASLRAWRSFYNSPSSRDLIAGPAAARLAMTRFLSLLMLTPPGVGALAMTKFLIFRVYFALRPAIRSKIEIAIQAMTLRNG